MLSPPPSPPPRSSNPPHPHTHPSLLHSSSLQISLQSSIQTLHLIHHRNKNQHRTQLWFRHLSCLLRNLRKLNCSLDVTSSTTIIITLGGLRESDRRREVVKVCANAARKSRHEDYADSSTDKIFSRKVATTTSNVNTNTPLQTAPETRKKSTSLPSSSSTSSSPSSVMEARITHLTTYIIPKAHTAFSSLIRDRQFSPLGCVLLAEVCRVWKLLGGGRYELVLAEEEVERTEGRDMAGAAGKATPEGQAQEEDLGEVIPR